MLILANSVLGIIFHGPLSEIIPNPEILNRIGLITGYLIQPLGLVLLLVGVFRVIQSLKQNWSPNFHSLVESSTVGVYLIQEGRFCYVNKRFAEMFGYTVHELIGTEFLKTVSPDVHEFVQKKIEERLVDPSITAPFEYCAVGKDGREFSVEVYGSMIKHEGRPALQGTVLDISVSELMQKSLADQEAQFRHLIEISPDAILIHIDQRVQFVNSAAVQLLGYASKQEVMGRNILGFFPADQRLVVSKRMENLLNSGERGPLVEERIRRSDGELCDVELVDLPARFRGKKAIQTVMRDISEKKEAQSLLNGQKRILELLARGISLSDVLNELVLFIENHGADMTCVIMLVDDNRLDLRVWASPNLPEHYQKAIDGLHIGPMQASCGAAAFRGEMVISSDIEREEIWDGYRRAALEAGFRACWSAPIRSRSGAVLGTFAMYFSEVRVPTLAELDLLEVATDMAGIALEKSVQEQERRKNEARYQHLFNALNDLVFVYRLDPERQPTNFIEVNELACKRLGYKKDSLLEMSLADVVTPDTLEKISRQQWGGSPGLIEGRCVCQNGMTIPVELNSHHFYFNGQEHMLSIVRDISERRAAEQELARSEERFRSLVQNSSDIISVLSSNGEITYLSQSVSKILGYTETQLNGRKVFDLLHPEDVPIVEQYLRALLDQPEAKLSAIEYRIRDAHKNWIWLESTGSNQLGNPVIAGIVINSRNISERKQIERALRESEERFRTIFEESGIGIALLRPDGQVFECNPTFRKMFKYNEAQALVLSFNDIVYPEDEQLTVENLMVSLESGAEVYKLDGRFICRDHEMVWGRLTASQVKDSEENAQFVVCMIENITEQVLARQALQNSEEKYRMLFNGGNDAVFVYRLGQDNRPGNYIEVNDVACKRLGYSREELLQASPATIYAPHQLYKLHDMVSTMRVKRHALIEATFMGKNGHEVPVEINAHIFDVQGIPTVVSIARDISERKQAQKALQESEQRYHSLFQGMPIGVYRSTPEGRILEGNPAIISMLGFESREELLAANAEELYLIKSDREKWRTIVEQVGVARSFETRLRRKDGSQIWVRENTRSVRDSRGNILYYEGSIEDITIRRKMESELEEEKERLSVTLKSIGDGVITTDLEGRVILINDVAKNLIGWPGDSAIECKIEDVFITQEEATGEPCKNPVHVVLESRRSVQSDRAVRLVSKDGQNHLVTTSAAPVLEKSGKVIGTVLVFRDVSKLLTLEEEVHKSQKLESLGVLAGGIAHDFNNILTAIIGNISLAQFITGSEESLKMRLAEAEKAAQRAKDLTMQLLTFAKGGAPIKTTASITGIIKETARFTLTGSASKCVYDLSDDLWTVVVDKGQISQVINNLVLNAAQAMPSGGVIRIAGENLELKEDQAGYQELLENGSYVKISISDEGVGIPHEYLSQIFDPYFTTKQKGSGLGLATCYSIIKRHGGHIFVESQQGVGTTFTLLLPAMPHVELTDELAFEALERGSGRILLMDDEQTILDIAGKMLTHLGYEVAFAKDGDETIRIYQDARQAGKGFDVVIMDLTVPGGMGGKEAVSRLRQIDPDLIAVVSSGYSTDPVMADFHKYGFAACIAKPYNLKRLSEVLSRVLQGQPAAAKAN